MSSIKPIPKEIVQLIPPFNGDKRQLNLYIRKCEYVIEQFKGDDEQNLYVFEVLTCKLRDDAAALLSDRKDIVTWSALKDLLIEHFGDPRSENSIYVELDTLRIKQGESYSEFYNKIKSVLSLLIAKMNISDNVEAKRAKMEIYNKTAFNTFLYNLPENIVQIVRIKAPATLEAALSIALEEADFLEQYYRRNNMPGNNHVFGHKYIPPTVTPRYGIPPQILQGFGVPRKTYNTQNASPNGLQSLNHTQPKAFGGMVFGSSSTPMKPTFGGSAQPASGITSQTRFGGSSQPAFGGLPQTTFGGKPISSFGATSQTIFGEKGLSTVGATSQTAFGGTPQPKFGGISQEQESKSEVKELEQQGLKLKKLTKNDSPDDLYYNDSFYYDNEFKSGDTDVGNKEVNQELADKSPLSNHFQDSLDRQGNLKLNCDPDLKHPYIYLEEINAKLIIDTGSMRSFLNPLIAYQYFGEYVTKEQFQVNSIHASSIHEEVIEIPLLPTFKSKDWHKFYLYDVDPRYDGLIGNDLLQQLGAVIDFKQQHLKTNTTCIPVINNN